MATRLPASRSSRDAACEKSSAASRNAKKRRRAVPGVPVDRQVVAMGQCEGPFSKQPGRLPAYRGRHPAPCRQTPPRQGMAPRQRLRAPGIALSRPAPLSWRALQWCKCKLEHLSGLPHCPGALQWIPVWPAPLLVHCSGMLAALVLVLQLQQWCPAWPAPLSWRALPWCNKLEHLSGLPHCWCIAVDTCLACPTVGALQWQLEHLSGLPIVGALQWIPVWPAPTVRTLQWHACSSC